MSCSSGKRYGLDEPERCDRLCSRLIEQGRVAVRPGFVFFGPPATGIGARGLVPRSNSAIMKQIVEMAGMCRWLVACAVFIVVAATVSAAASAADEAALRRQCAHLLKLKLGIKETGSVQDLRGIPGAIAQVDRCVANRGKLQ